jgi:hypothetical protein
MVALPFLLWATVAHAQSMRSFGTFRQTHGETRLATRIEYAAGTLRVAPGKPTELYRMDLSFDENRYLPVSDFNSSSGTAVLGLRPAGESGVHVVSQRQLRQLAAIALSPAVDLSLNLALGAVDADLELGGLRITNLDLKTGASRTAVHFSDPNGIRCQRARFSAGAAEVSVFGLGNTRCDEIQFDGGIGKVLLDFGGAWSSSTRVEARMAVGGLTLRLPRKVGVRITMDKFLSSFEPVGLVRRGEAFESPNYGRTQRQLNIDLTTAVGGVDIEWE